MQERNALIHLVISFISYHIRPTIHIFICNLRGPR